jgi:hypothetical protein
MTREKLLAKLAKVIEKYEDEGEVIGVSIYFPKSKGIGNRKKLHWDGEKFS